MSRRESSDAAAELDRKLAVYVASFHTAAEALRRQEIGLRKLNPEDMDLEDVAQMRIDFANSVKTMRESMLVSADVLESLRTLHERHSSQGDY